MASDSATEPFQPGTLRGGMDDLLDYAFSEPNKEPPFEDEQTLLNDLMQAIDAPENFTSDDLLVYVEAWSIKLDMRRRLNVYVDELLAHPEWSYERIRQELQAFADSCEPPITHMQARTLAFIEKRKRAEKGDMAAYANLAAHKRRHWRLSTNVENALWMWVTDRWANKSDTKRSGREQLARELQFLAEKLRVPQQAVENWVRAVIINLAKMQRGRVKITGMPVKIIVRAAIDDTAP